MAETQAAPNNGFIFSFMNRFMILAKMIPDAVAIVAGVRKQRRMMPLIVKQSSSLRLIGRSFSIFHFCLSLNRHQYCLMTIIKLFRYLIIVISFSLMTILHICL